MSDSWDEEFLPSAGTRSYLRWAAVNGAATLGEAHDLLEVFEVGNDVPEVLGHDETVTFVREEVEVGVELLGADAPLDDVL